MSAHKPKKTTAPSSGAPSIVDALAGDARGVGGLERVADAADAARRAIASTPAALATPCLPGFAGAAPVRPPAPVTGDLFRAKLPPRAPRRSRPDGWKLEASGPAPKGGECARCHVIGPALLEGSDGSRICPACNAQSSPAPLPPIPPAATTPRARIVFEDLGDGYTVDPLPNGYIRVRCRSSGLESLYEGDGTHRGGDLWPDRIIMPVHVIDPARERSTRCGLVVRALEALELPGEGRPATCRECLTLPTYRCCCSYPSGPHTLNCLNANPNANP